MAATQIRGTRVLDRSIKREDIALGAIFGEHLDASAKQSVLESKSVILYTQVLGNTVSGASASINVQSLTASTGPGVNGLVISIYEGTNLANANAVVVDLDGNPYYSNDQAVFARAVGMTSNAGNNFVTLNFYIGDSNSDSATPYSFPGSVPVILGLSTRKNIYSLGERDLIGGFTLVSESARDVQTVTDLAELYSKTGVVKNQSNTYTTNNYVANGDTLKAAISKLDAAARAINEAHDDAAEISYSGNATGTNVKAALDGLKTYADTIQAGITGNEVIATSVIGAGTHNLTGDVNGTNNSFQLPFTAVSIPRVKVYSSGVLLLGAGNDYTISGTTLTFTVAPEVGEILQVIYYK